MRLNPQAEILRRLGDPFLCGGIFQQKAKGEVHFHRIQLAGVVSQQLRLREFFGIEGGLPARVSPSGCADVKLRHAKPLTTDETGEHGGFYQGRFSARRGPLLFLRRTFFSACAAISTRREGAVVSASPTPVSFGSFCFSVSSGANKSPIFSTRCKTCCDSKTIMPAYFFFKVRSPFSLLGVFETLGLSRALSE